METKLVLISESEWMNKKEVKFYHEQVSECQRGAVCLSWASTVLRGGALQGCMEKLVRHCQTKGAETDRLFLNSQAGSLLAH